MKTISSTDVIYATVKQHGRILASFKLIGIKTMAEIFNYAKNLLSGIKGLVTLQLRNYSQGWNQEKSIMCRI